MIFRHNHRQWSHMLCAVLFMSIVRAASAAPILWVDDSSGNLGTVDVATGTVHVIGNTGHILTDIAFDPSGNLFGITFGQLFRIDKNTAAATLIAHQQNHARRLMLCLAVALDKSAGQVAGLEAQLAHLNPESILERGYSIVTREDGGIVRDAQQLHVDEPVTMRFARGQRTGRIIG